MLKSIRITIAIVLAVACTALIGLWVRSYFWMDQIYGHTSESTLLHLGSMHGQLTVRLVRNYPGTLPAKYNWVIEHEAVAEIMARQQKVNEIVRDLLVYRFKSNHGRLRDGVYFPHWEAALVSCVIATVIGLGRPKRFSLRAMFIVVTVAAAAIAFLATFTRK